MGDAETEAALTREIKKKAKKDKIQWRIRNLENLTDLRHAWKQIKYTKNEYTPRFYDMKDIRGNRVPLSKKAHAVAEYLFEKQWGPNDAEIPPDPTRDNVFGRHLRFYTDCFSKQEIKSAISKLQNNKAPGPDGTAVELFKYLDADTLDAFTECLI